MIYTYIIPLRSHSFLPFIRGLYSEKSRFLLTWSLYPLQSPKTSTQGKKRPCLPASGDCTVRGLLHIKRLRFFLRINRSVYKRYIAANNRPSFANALSVGKLYIWYPNKLVGGAPQSPLKPWATRPNPANIT
jgi:hypothetical protein